MTGGGESGRAPAPEPGDAGRDRPPQRAGSERPATEGPRSPEARFEHGRPSQGSSSEHMPEEALSQGSSSEHMPEEAPSRGSSSEHMPGGPRSHGPVALEATRIRGARPSDLGSVVEIEVASYSTPWNPTAFRSLLSRERAIFLVAECRGRVVGHGILWWVADEAELANLAVAPDARGRGIGRHLLDRLLEGARAEGISRVFLEVRESNEAAFALYEARGFRQVGVRPHYYDHPREDARVLLLDLKVR